MNSTELQKRLEAAHDILDDKKTTFEKFAALKNLVKGLSSQIDLNLEAAGKELEKLEHMHKGELLELVIEEIPEITEEEKKRKKFLLLFNKHWKEIKSEVTRIQNELKEVKQHGNTAKSQAKGLGRIIGFAKGPLGLITIIAAGIVILNSLSVKVIVKNIGCQSISLLSSPFPIPGMSLPREPIPDGSSAVATLPPLTVGVDSTTPGSLTITIFGISKSFDFGAKDIQFDGTSLTGRNTSLHLGERKEHELKIICKS